jgi:Tetraacyldisaccharide-1-P 4''-kinase
MSRDQHRQSTVGGTGKTPIVEKFARALQAEDGEWRFLAVVTKASRGDAIGGAGSAEILSLHVVSDGKSLLLDSLTAGDEPYMLAHNLKM